MKILWISQRGQCLPLVKRMQEEGDDVLLYIRQRPSELVGLGIVEQAPTWKSIYMDQDLICFDDWELNYLTKSFNQFEGVLFGLNQIAGMANASLVRQLQVFQRCNIRHVDCTVFESPGHAKDLLSAFPPQGVAIIPGERTRGSEVKHICSRPELLEYALELIPSDTKVVAIPLMPDSFEVVTTFWYNQTPQRYEARFVHCIAKGLAASVDKDRITEEAVKLVAFLNSANYRGPITIRWMVGEDVLQARSMTMGFEWDVWWAFQHCMQPPISEFFTGGEEARVNMVKWLAGTHLLLGSEGHQTGLPIVGLPDDYQPHNLYRDNGAFRWAGSGRDLATVTKEVKKPSDAIAFFESELSGTLGTDVVRMQPNFRELEKTVRKIKRWGYI